MKKIFTAVLFLSCSAVFAQQQVMNSTRGTMTAADFNTRKPTITDQKIYDMAGNVIDSAKAEQMAKTFEYEIAKGKPAGQTEIKRVLKKVNNYQNAQSNKGSRAFMRPKSRDLWEGMTLDLKPFAKRIDTAKLQGKAIVLLFRAKQYPPMYSGINDAVANNLANNKFEVFAITDLSYGDAVKAQKIDPILNAHNLVEAQEITSYYDLEHEAAIVVTNTRHQITYAVTGLVFTTPWMLNNLLKSL